MKPGTKLVLLMFGLMIPYMSFFIYFAMQSPSGHLPTWLTNTLAIWFCCNFAIAILLARRIFGTRSNSGDVAKLSPQNVTAVEKWTRKSIGLVALWTCLFLYGLYEVSIGSIPLRRAAPAGLMLLVFIVIFSRSIYKSSTAIKTSRQSV